MASAYMYIHLLIHLLVLLHVWSSRNPSTVVCVQIVVIGLTSRTMFGANFARHIEMYLSVSS